MSKYTLHLFQQTQRLVLRLLQQREGLNTILTRSYQMTALPMTVTILVLWRYPSRSAPAKQVTYKVLLSAMTVNNMLVLDMFRVGRGVRSWSITTRRGGEGGWPVE